MKVLKRWLLPLLALLLAAAGAAMPYAVSTLQDASVEKTREDRPLAEVSLTLQKGEDVQDVLRLLAGSTEELDDLEWQGKTHMTPEEAAGAAREAMRSMQDSGLVNLIPEEWDDPTVSMEPHLIMSMEESSLSAIVWVCWLGETPYNWIFIDDESGKMVRAFLDEPQLTENVSATRIETSYGQDWEEHIRYAELWRKFLSGYYGMELFFDETETDIYDDGYSLYCTFFFDGEQERGQIRLEMQGTAVYLNS